MAYLCTSKISSSTELVIYMQNWDHIWISKRRFPNIMPTVLWFSWRQVYSAPTCMSSFEKVRHSVLCGWAGQAQGMSLHITWTMTVNGGNLWKSWMGTMGYTPPTSFAIFSLFSGWQFLGSLRV